MIYTVREKTHFYWNPVDWLLETVLFVILLIHYRTQIS